MDVHFDPDLQARLTERASEAGRAPSEFVRDVIALYFEQDSPFVAAVKRGEAALERGEWMTHEEVGERLKRFLRD